MKIQIPTPCHEDWRTMNPGEKGRFCNACCKTVVDFTGMTPEAISTYLKDHRSQRVCGRFNTDQLAPENPTMLSLTRLVWLSAMSNIKKMAAIFLLLFAFSQQAQAQTADKAPQKDSAGGQYVKGKIVVCPPKPEPNEKKTPAKYNKDNHKPGETVTGKKMIPMGMIAINPKEKQ